MKNCWSRARRLSAGERPRPKMTRQVLLFAVVVALVLVPNMAPSGAQSGPAGKDQPPSAPVEEIAPADDPAPADNVKVLSGSEAQSQDAEAISTASGEPVAETAEKLAFQQRVLDIIGSLPPEILSESYAGAVFMFPESRATLYFKGAVPEEAQARRDAANIANLDLVGGQKYSLDELSRRQNVVHDAFVELGFTQLVSQFDVVSQVITTEVALHPGRPDLRGQALRDAVRASAREKGIEIEPDLLRIIERPAPEPLTILEHSWGGAGLRVNGVFNCTSAFTVKRASDGVEGTLTASHCEGLNQMDENDGSGGVTLTFSAPFASEHIGTFGDIEWHTTSHVDYPEFWSTATSRRPVQGRIANSQISQNAFVCHFGRSSGYSCGNVSSVSTNSTFEWAGCGGCTVTARDMVAVVNANSAGGDSGGPWFNSYTAWGIHHGRRSNGERLFSKIQNAESAFGVAVELT